MSPIASGFEIPILRCQVLFSHSFDWAGTVEVCVLMAYPAFNILSHKLLWCKCHLLNTINMCEACVKTSISDCYTIHFTMSEKVHVNWMVIAIVIYIMVTNGKHECLLPGKDLSYTEMWYECWRFQLFTVDFSQSFKVTSHNQSCNVVDCVVSCCALQPNWRLSKAWR